jgi:hypothetical protein
MASSCESVSFFALVHGTVYIGHVMLRVVASVSRLILNLSERLPFVLNGLTISLAVALPGMGAVQSTMCADCSATEESCGGFKNRRLKSKQIDHPDAYCHQFPGGPN